jgi:3-isopropylmalate/(R)-2-methylmalate dehydratase small subunit
MAGLNKLSGPAIPLATPNIDTDVIIRIDRLAELDRGELGPYAFEAIRFDADGNKRSDSVLNDPGYADAPILIAGENFGCGSSREGAVWAIQERGIRCIIAPEFGGIFANNCFQNGVLTIVLPVETVDHLRAQCQPTGNAKFEIDLEAQTVTAPDGTVATFEIDALRKEGLLRGLDPVGLTQLRSAEIAAFQNQDRTNRPWIYGGFG